MVLKKLQNPAGVAIVWTGTDEKLVGKSESTEANWFKPKKGSVFPAKRRLVKTMVLHSILKFVASVLSSAEANPISLSPPKIPNAKKCNHSQILPYPNSYDDGKLAMRR